MADFTTRSRDELERLAADLTAEALRLRAELGRWGAKADQRRLDWLDAAGADAVQEVAWLCRRLKVTAREAVDRVRHLERAEREKDAALTGGDRDGD